MTPPEGLTEPSASYSDNVCRLLAVAQAVGAIPLVLDYREHDRVTAAISHLPHLVASSLVNLVKDSDSPEGIMRRVAAGGFKDITRIASCSPEMWEQICMTNAGPIGDMLEQYIGSLQDILDQIRGHKDKEIYRLFENHAPTEIPLQTGQKALSNPPMNFQLMWWTRWDPFLLLPLF